MRLTLIKAAKTPDDTADLGVHEFTYSLLPHSGDRRNGGTMQEAWSLNAPLTTSEGVPEQRAPASVQQSIAA